MDIAILAGLMYPAFDGWSSRAGGLIGGLRDGCDFVSTNIKKHTNRLESMIPIVASFIQLRESRRALWKTANVTRLTVLAIVFVPLSFIATIF